MKKPKSATAQAGFDEQIKRLLAATKRDHMSLHDLCDALGMCPRDTLALVDAAKEAGYAVDIADGRVGRADQSARVDKPVRLTVEPTVGDWTMLGVISDTHIGSRWFMRKQLNDFVKYAANCGVSTIVHAGDLTDGPDKHRGWEKSVYGWEATKQAVYKHLPRVDGVKYVAIAGNHDLWWTDATGMDPLSAIEDDFRLQGRDDFRYLGANGAMLDIDGVRIELHHPRSGKTYALSYPLQVHLRDMPSATGRKPDVLIAGHRHSFCYFQSRAVHAIQAPCFQGGSGAFGRSLSGAPVIGGLIIGWRRTRHGTLRGFSCEPRVYYERECVRRIV